MNSRSFWMSFGLVRSKPLTHRSLGCIQGNKIRRFGVTIEALLGGPNAPLSMHPIKRFQRARPFLVDATLPSVPRVSPLSSWAKTRSALGNLLNGDLDRRSSAAPNLRSSGFDSDVSGKGGCDSAGELGAISG